ncbi:nucleic acid-binding, OB-fold protein [Artemisia annua]|uniref:Nucleic acid-binding, OB-fold protein n=1 Tax=Artemisia annua TaxID=35608 RepID=A0A2U1LXC2_ARTAN|nr:nucleic acid-binding, OB-fold protein [Artemisia annua]
MADKGEVGSVTAMGGAVETVEQNVGHQIRDKGKGILLQEDVVNLMDLKPDDLTKPLEIQGGAIQANVQLWDMRQFDAKLQVNSCYKIVGFGSKKTDKWQRTLPNKITLLLGKYTQFTPIEARGFPLHHFNFAAYNEIGHRADSRDSILTAVTLTFTVWNEMATAFDVNKCAGMEQPVIIAISSCWADVHFAGKLQLSATPATSYYLNPDVLKADHIRQLSHINGTLMSLDPQTRMKNVVDLMDLKPDDLTKPLEIQVYRKWASRNVPDPNPTGLCFIFLDKRAVQLWDMRQFDAKLQVNSCYKIVGFGSKKTDKWQRTLPNKITLLLGKYTQVTPIEARGFPLHHFNFAAYNEIGHRADSRDSILTAVTLTFTVWNEMATAFDVNKCAGMEQSVIIAISSCWARHFAGELQLSATPSTSYYLNPDVLKADHIRQL